MRHRGPDGSGEWWEPDGLVGLVHRRLSIIDLSEAGLQPMHDGRGTTIVLNGEIYNYLELRAELAERGFNFTSRTDTEVVLAAYREWGDDCLHRLNGMFAFALYDARAKRLLLARDRAGEKPLFYSETDGEIRFASELKALMADASFERRIDPVALASYLRLGFVAGSESILSGVKKLEPACALAFNLVSGRSRLWRYWQPPPFSPAEVGEESLLDELDALLSDSVQRQLIADVPIGILLSGGVDSSLVTAMAARTRSAVKTFTIRFPNAGRHDETEHARLIASHFGTDHIELDAEPSTVDLLPVLARQFDEPLIDSSMIPTFLVSRLVRRHCTVALGGDGGDELFGGYSHYDRLLWLQRRFGRLPGALRSAISKAATSLLPLGTKGRNWLQAIDTDFERDVPLVALYFDDRGRRRLLNDRMSTEAPEVEPRPVAAATGDLLQRATRTDFGSYLPNDILVKVDRASMPNSLEVRAPMLDYRVIEFAFGKVPSHLKATPSGRKILLKRLAARVLPARFDLQRKQGFSIPISSWLQQGQWLNYFQEVLFDSQQELFDHRFVRKLFEGQAKGRSNGERLFGLVMFELWRREYQPRI